MKTKDENQWRIAKAKRYNEWIFNVVKPFIGDRVLEIGCSNGKITQFLTDCKLCIGIDIDEKMIKYVRERFKETSNIKVLNCDITKEQKSGFF